MKNSALKIILAILILSMLLTGCGRNKADNSKDTLLINARNAICKEGILVSDKGVMTYYDYETGQGTILCTRLQCNHDVYDKDTNPNPECPAVSPDKCPIKCAFITNGKLYFATEGFVDKEKGIVTSKLYKADLNGENRAYLGEIDYNFPINTAFIHENYLFGIVTSIKVVSEADGNVETQSFSRIIALDLNTLEITYLSEPNETSGNLQAYVYDGKLYCMFRKLGTELDELSEIRVFSLKDFSLADTIQTKGFSFVKYCKDNMYYAFSSEGTDKINLCRRSLKTGKETILHVFSDTKNVSCGIFTVAGDYIFYMLSYYDGVNPSENRGTYVFNMKDESIIETDFSYSGVYAPISSSVDDEHILLDYAEKGKVVYRYMKAIDFINKSMDFIDIKPSE